MLNPWQSGSRETGELEARVDQDALPPRRPLLPAHIAMRSSVKASIGERSIS